ncbi:hypothetical protein SAMN05443247_04556 [Bradyrhizobium erythrophlei]|jgi:hypothetical protein|nr:hypothetical protein SAMN05443247_04556 [Bradyrhizobium erythrophlei]
MSKKSFQTSVADLDREKAEVYFRTGLFARRKGVRQPAEVAKAKGRVRAARWRSENDSAGRPETADVALALLRSLVRLHDQESIEVALSVAEMNVVQGMVGELTDAGYRLEEIKVVCKRLRRRVLAEESDR